jgi:hypothetical protein
LSYSLETQRQQITGYAMIKGWTVAEFFVENGVSGSVPFASAPKAGACSKQQSRAT